MQRNAQQSQNPARTFTTEQPVYIEILFLLALFREPFDALTAMMLINQVRILKLALLLHANYKTD